MRPGGALGTVSQMQQRIAIRELRRRPRHYLARMVAGERFEVTAFGRPIADLGAISYRATTINATMLIDGISVPLPAETEFRD